MAKASDFYQHRTSVASDGTRGRRLSLEVCRPESNKFSGSMLYMPGFAEVHWHSENTRRLLAQKGIISLCPELRPGDKPDVIFQELMQHRYFQYEGSEGKRSAVTHSNGIRAFRGEMTEERLDELQAHVDDLTICNGPLHKEPSLPVLMYRYWQSYVQAVQERRWLEIAHDIPTVASWASSPKFLREIRDTQQDLSSIEPNIRAIADRYGAALNFVVDPNDKLCPPDDLLEWHAQYIASKPDDPALHPTVYTDTNGHSPSYREPGKFALLIRTIARKARGLRRDYLGKAMPRFALRKTAHD